MPLVYASYFVLSLEPKQNYRVILLSTYLVHCCSFPFLSLQESGFPWVCLSLSYQKGPSRFSLSPCLSLKPLTWSGEGGAYAVLSYA